MRYAAHVSATMAVVAAIGIVASTMGVSAQAPDKASGLPRSEIAGQQIGWAVNETIEAFVEAVESNRPLVVVFGDSTSNFTQKLIELVLPCPHVNQLAGAAVFAYGSPLIDEYARRMAVRLKLTTYPTISVIAPRTDRLTELHRIEGLFDAQSTAQFLRNAMERNGYWPKARPAQAGLPTHVLAYPGKACTREGARRLGIDVNY